jgi:hypothetical protein
VATSKSFGVRLRSIERAGVTSRAPVLGALIIDRLRAHFAVDDGGLQRNGTAASSGGAIAAFGRAVFGRQSGGEG